MIIISLNIQVQSFDMSSTKEPLIKLPKPAHLDSSELQTPANTMNNPPIYWKKKDKDETCCSLKECVYISACSCGISSIIFTILHL
jgi:hypothetical protein